MNPAPDASNAPATSPTATSVLTIDLGALRANYRTLHDSAAGAECAAVLKANAAAGELFTLADLGKDADPTRTSAQLAIWQSIQHAIGGEVKASVAAMATEHDFFDEGGLPGLRLYNAVFHPISTGPEADTKKHASNVGFMEAPQRLPNQYYDVISNGLKMCRSSLSSEHSALVAPFVVPQNLIDNIFLSNYNFMNFVF